MSLFMAQVIFSLVLSVAPRRPVRALILVSFLVAIGFINSRTMRLAVPWSAAIALVGLLFLALGYRARRSVAGWTRLTSGANLATIILLAGVVLVAAAFNDPVIMGHNSYGSIPLFLVGATCGIAMALLLSMLLERLYHLAAPLSGAAAGTGSSGRISRAFFRSATACLTYLGRNALITLPMHVLAAHWLMQMPFLANPLPAGAAQKLLAALILLVSVEVFRRCPLIVPRKPAPVAAVPAHARQTSPLAAGARADVGDH